MYNSDLDSSTDPTIPQNTLSEFLESSVNIRELANVLMVEDNYLWTKGSVNRHRVNVWMQEYQDGKYCPRNYIGFSFFLQHNTESDTIKDLTIEQTITLETVKQGMF